MKHFHVGVVLASCFGRSFNVSSGKASFQCFIFVYQYHAHYFHLNISICLERLEKLAQFCGEENVRWTPISIQAWSTSGLGSWRYIEVTNSVELNFFGWYEIFTSGVNGASLQLAPMAFVSPLIVDSQGIEVFAGHSASNLPGQWDPMKTPKANPKMKKDRAMTSSRLHECSWLFCFRLFYGCGSSNNLTSSSFTILL